MSKEQQDNDDRAAMISKLLPLRMTSKVIRGFGRGSKDLGIPTANLDLTALQLLSGSNSSNSSIHNLDELPCGIYWGFGKVGRNQDAHDDQDAVGHVYTTALSIGYNPTYGNGTWQQVHVYMCVQATIMGFLQA
jgi:riboflavin kinase